MDPDPDPVPDLYACLLQPDTGLGASNSGFVDHGGGLVVDTLYDLPRTQRLIDLYATVAEAPARRLVNTHHNGDHCWGNQLFAEAGTEIIGHRLCAEYFEARRPPPEAVRQPVRGRQESRLPSPRWWPRCATSTSTTSCSPRPPP